MADITANNNMLIELPDGAWETVDAPRRQPGSYIVFVNRIEDKTNGANKQVMLHLHDEAGVKVVGDLISFSQAAMPIALCKLQALGFTTDMKVLPMADLIGRKVRVHVSEIPYVTSNGEHRTSLKVDINKGSNKGYEPVL